MAFPTKTVLAAVGATFAGLAVTGTYGMMAGPSDCWRTTGQPVGPNCQAFNKKLALAGVATGAAMILLGQRYGNRPNSGARGLTYAGAIFALLNVVAAAEPGSPPVV